MLAVVTLALSVLAINANSLNEANLAGQSEEAYIYRNALEMLQDEIRNVKSFGKDDPENPMYSEEEEKEMEEALAEAAASDDPKRATLAKAAKGEPRAHLRAAMPKKQANKAVLKKGKDISIPNHAGLNAIMSDLLNMGSQNLSPEEAANSPFGKAMENITQLLDSMMPKVTAEHEKDQAEMNSLGDAFVDCNHAKDKQFHIAQPDQNEYKGWSPKHLTCRETEAGLAITKATCWENYADKKKIMELKCKAFAMAEERYANQKMVQIIATKAQREGSEGYVRRVSDTICGRRDTRGEGGHGQGGFADRFMQAKNECEKVTLDVADQKKKCQGTDTQLAHKRRECDNIQDQMDGAACKYAINIKDACEEYEECYNSRKEAFTIAEKATKINTKDRKAEWQTLSRMKCLLGMFSDEKVTAEELKTCNETVADDSQFTINYPTIDDMGTCQVPREYPSTSEYKQAQFANLPELAKGRANSFECTGVQEISTVPATGSPEGCKCRRITMNGPYSAGPLVKCVNCNDIRRTDDKSSCPDGTKLFSPRSRSDWQSFIASAQPVRAPNFIVDVTRSAEGCAACEKSSMNSGSSAQKSWGTQDGSPWWLRSSKFEGFTGHYQANCFMDVLTSKHEDSVTFSSHNCDYHSKSYYCQLMDVSTTPKNGSPVGCMCQKVALSGHFSAKTLVKCKGCLDVSKSTQKNSCPHGTKIFAPATREDWKTFLDSATVLRSPNFIFDVTKPQDGCRDCTKFAMNSDQPEQAVWRTSDGSPWWLRSVAHSEPTGDYEANCYMDLLSSATENAIMFNDDGCKSHSDSYYCQVASKQHD